MLRGYPLVRRWEQTDDVLQNSMMRLYRALAEQPPGRFFAATRTDALEWEFNVVNGAGYFAGSAAIRTRMIAQHHTLPPA